MKNRAQKFYLNLYTKFLGSLIKKGNKIKAKKVIDVTFLSLSKLTNYSISFLLYKLFYKLNVFIEAKEVRFRKRINIIPFSITLERRLYLIIKWLLLAVKSNTKNIPISQKITEEILSIFIGNSSSALRLRSLNNVKVLASRSNMHYRW